MNCKYEKIEVTPYHTDWGTECGNIVRCSGPVDVGFSPDPLPNKDGAFCHHCGKEIEIVKGLV